jgi:catechol 2,3-dioxygenase-like lactoylglutathione lyase family enzyme
MTDIQLNLVVIRASNLERATAFYQLLGLDFVKHRHGNGLEHFACDLGTVVFEIYPRTSEADSTTATRLGFRVASVDAAIAELEKRGVPVISPPKNSPWGWHAVVTDPDGHKVELTELKQQGER